MSSSNTMRDSDIPLVKLKKEDNKLPIQKVKEIPDYLDGLLKSLRKSISDPILLKVKESVQTAAPSQASGQAMSALATFLGGHSGGSYGGINMQTVCADPSTLVILGATGLPWAYSGGLLHGTDFSHALANLGLKASPGGIGNGRLWRYKILTGPEGLSQQSLIRYLRLLNYKNLKKGAPLLLSYTINAFSQEVEIDVIFGQWFVKDGVKRVIAYGKGDSAFTTEYLPASLYFEKYGSTDNVILTTTTEGSPRHVGFSPLLNRKPLQSGSDSAPAEESGDESPAGTVVFCEARDWAQWSANTHYVQPEQILQNILETAPFYSSSLKGGEGMSAPLSHLDLEPDLLSLIEGLEAGMKFFNTILRRSDLVDFRNFIPTSK